MSYQRREKTNWMTDEVQVGDATQFGEDIGYQKVEISQNSFSDEVSVS